MVEDFLETIFRLFDEVDHINTIENLRRKLRINKRNNILSLANINTEINSTFISSKIYRKLKVLNSSARRWKNN
jgi:hypothetical protein